MTDEQMYDQWIANRRAVDSSPDLSDRIMAELDQRKHGLHLQPSVCLADRIGESQFACWAACATALLVGTLPFLLGAYLAQSVVF